MKGTKYLSELVDCSALQKGQLNVIKAPTGSGKTYFALNYIPSLTNDALHNVVYLIDTINGKEQIVRNYNATSEYYGWSKEVESGGMWFEPDNRVVVITYAKFGVLFERNIEFYKNFFRSSIFFSCNLTKSDNKFSISGVVKLDSFNNLVPFITPMSLP